MKLLLTLVSILYAFNFSHAQSERIIYENFRPKGKEIGFDLPGEVEIKYWSRDKIRILTIINADCDSIHLSNFIDSGRYDIKQTPTEGISYFSMPKQFLFPARSDDKVVKESFKFEVHLPEGYIVRDFNEKK